MMGASVFVFFSFASGMLLWVWFCPAECGKWLGQIARAYREELGRGP